LPRSAAAHEAAELIGRLLGSVDTAAPGGETSAPTEQGGQPQNTTAPTISQLPGGNQGAVGPDKPQPPVPASFNIWYIIVPGAAILLLLILLIVKRKKKEE
jgi:hypothetical protein